MLRTTRNVFPTALVHQATVAIYDHSLPQWMDSTQVSEIIASKYLVSAADIRNYIKNSRNWQLSSMTQRFDTSHLSHCRSLQVLSHFDSYLDPLGCDRLGSVHQTSLVTCWPSVSFVSRVALAIATPRSVFVSAALLLIPQPYESTAFAVKVQSPDRTMSLANLVDRHRARCDARHLCMQYQERERRTPRPLKFACSVTRPIVPTIVRLEARAATQLTQFQWSCGKAGEHSERPAEAVETGDGSAGGDTSIIQKLTLLLSLQQI